MRNRRFFRLCHARRLARVEADVAAGNLTRRSADDIAKRMMQDTFYGGEANEGVAAAAKMNMIIAGDGHTNIQRENSLSRTSTVWDVSHPIAM